MGFSHLLLCFSVIVSVAFAAQKYEPRFNRWEFGFTSGPNRWADGRSFDGASELAQLVGKDADQYWSSVSKVWDGFVRKRSQQAIRQWNGSVRKNEKLMKRVSNACLDVIEHMILHPYDQEWSAKMIDSMSTYPAGILSGTTTELGDFDQCLSINGHFGQDSFAGKYCLATVNLPRPTLYEPITFNASVFKAPWMAKFVEQWYHLDNKYPMSTAVCFPSVCHQEEIKDILQSYYPFLQSFEFDVTYCQSRLEPREYDPRIIIPIGIISSMMAIVTLAWLFDLFMEPVDESSPMYLRVLDSFSPIRNTKILFHITEPNTEGVQFNFIHGLRAICSIFIMVAHGLALMVQAGFHVNAYARFPTDFKDMLRTFWIQPFFNGGLLVHTFFLLSGLMLSYNSLAPRLKFNFPSYVALRWLRYSPAVIGMICMALAFEIFCVGPLCHHDHLAIILDGCYDYWWTNLLYIHHLVPLDHECSAQSWYLGSEMQLHILAFILLFAYTLSPRLSYWTSIIFIGLQFVCVTWMFLSGWVSPTIFQFVPFIENPFPQYFYNLRVTYLFTFNHFVPYFVGAFLGQLLLEGKIVRFSKLKLRLYWFLAIAFIVFMFCHTYPLMQQDPLPFNQEGNLTFSVVTFTLTLGWSVANGWVVYQCATNSTNAMARFLSAKIFQPFSRLSFCLYLMHFMTLWHNALQTRTMISLAGLTGLFQMVSLTFVQSFLLAYFVYLTFEAPGVNLIKLFYASSVRPPKSSPIVPDINANDVFDHIDDDTVEQTKKTLYFRKSANASIQATLKTLN